MTDDQENKIITSRYFNSLEDARVSGKVCPICHNGAGEDGTGITSRDGGRHWHCFKCCTDGDAFDFVGKQYGIDGYTKRRRKAAALVGFILSSEVEGETFLKDRQRRKTKSTLAGAGASAAGASAPATTTGGTPEAEEEQKGKPMTDQEKETNRQLVKEAHTRGVPEQYRRGISEELLDYYGVGFCPEFRHGGTTTQRVIIPTNYAGTCYNARYVPYDQKLPRGTQKYIRPRASTEPIFPSWILSEATDYVFVVEGEFDALSVLECGGQAVALGGVGNVDKFLSIIDQLRPQKLPRMPLLLVLDADGAGEAAQKKLAAGLKARSVPYFEVDITGGHKDPSEFLQADRAGFCEAIQRARNIERDALAAEAVCEYLPQFYAEIEANKDTDIKTGFPALDTALGGGIFPGLYVVGAVSGAGKTTFCLQLADNIAQTGREVLFFSLEMDRRELVAKSLSRLSFIKSGLFRGYAKCSRAILRGEKTKPEYDKYMPAALEEYRKISRSLYVFEGSRTADEIRAEVEKHTRITGTPPVVFVDYLQIISPVLERGTDKQNTDAATLALKQISRACKAPVFAISSFNRENYTQPVNLASFKESGAVEYSSDILIGLQTKGVGEYRDGETGNRTAEDKRKRRLWETMEANAKAAKDGKSIKIEVKILKNRLGSTGAPVELDFFPMFNGFFDNND